MKTSKSKAERLRIKAQVIRRYYVEYPERAETGTGKARLAQGTKVMANGYPGVIVRHYDGEMYEIRLPGGVVCTDQWELPETAGNCRNGRRYLRRPVRLKRGSSTMLRSGQATRIFNMSEPTDIISRMEAMQQRFNPFPSLLVSAENERRLQLEESTEPEPRTFDAEDAEEWQRQSEEQGAE